MHAEASKIVRGHLFRGSIVPGGCGKGIRVLPLQLSCAIMGRVQTQFEPLKSLFTIGNLEAPFVALSIILDFSKTG